MLSHYKHLAFFICSLAFDVMVILSILETLTNYAIARLFSSISIHRFRGENDFAPIISYRVAFRRPIKCNDQNLSTSNVTLGQLLPLTNIDQRHIIQ